MPQVHRLFGEIGDWESTPIRTLELDVLVDRPPIDGEAVVAALRAQGFRPAGPGNPPAIWERAVTGGERIEFFVGHRGTGRAIGRTTAADDDGALGGISLPGLERAAACTVHLDVPIGLREDGFETRRIKVLDLGAFLVQKAANFARRPDRSRSAKDVLYIVQVMAAGDEVQAYVEQRVEAHVTELAVDLRTADHNLDLLLNSESALSPLLRMVAEMLSELDGGTVATKMASTAGYLTDFQEILTSLDPPRR